MIWFATSANALELPVKDRHLADCLTRLAQKHQWQKPADFTEIVCHNQKIQSVQGIDAFPNITKLSLHKNRITALALTNLRQLRHLNLAKNALQTLELQGLDKLEELYLFNNRLAALDLQDMPALVKIRANSNQLATIDLGHLAVLSKLYLFDNKLETLDIDTLPALQYLDVRHNPMPDELYDFLDRQPGLTALHDGNAEDWQ